MRSDGELVIGTVIMSMPEYGRAKVELSGGTRNMKPAMMCYLPYSDATCGALLQPHIQDGSTVICMRSSDNPDIGYILTAVNVVNADMTDTTSGRVFYRVNKMTTRRTKIFDTLINQMKDFIGASFRNNANSVDSDVLPGDVDIVNHGGAASLHVGRSIVQLKGSPMAFIDVASISDQIRLVASTVSTHTVTTFKQTGDDVSVDDTAYNAAEAFGLGREQEVEAKLEDVEKYTVPFYRQQEVKGAVVDGKEKTIVTFPADTDEHTDTTEPPVLSRQRSSLSGELSSLSAHSISIGKTASIPSILQFGYHSVNSRTEENKKLELLTPYDYSAEEEKTDEKEHDLQQEISDAAINKILDKMLSGDYRETLKAKLASVGLYIGSRTLNQQFKWEETEGQIAGPTKQQQYGLPKYLQLEDPATGKVHTYFDSNAFIHFEEDGSILLCDGYGSEIRMSQGNIYISPALDLFCRPGRDMSAMVPRHMSLNVQGYAVINSTKNIYIRATGDLMLAAATEGEGRLTLECDDDRNTDSTGILIKSLGNASFTGHNMYIGINKGTSKSAGRVEQTEDPGTIILDAGNKGAIIEHSSRHLSDTELFTVVTTGSSNTAFTVGGNIIGLYAEQVVAPTTLNMSTMEGSQKVDIVRDGEIKTITLSTASSPYILLKGNMRLSGGVTVEGGIVAYKYVVTRQSAYVTDGRIKDDKDTFPDIKFNNIKVNKSLAESSGAAYVTQLTQTLYQDLYVANNSFSFPESYGITELKVPGMVWQEATREIVGDVSQVSWEEKPFISVTGTTTACYPGWEIWQSAKITKTGYEEANLIDNYITNTTKENTNA